MSIAGLFFCLLGGRRRKQIWRGEERREEQDLSGSFVVEEKEKEEEEEERERER